MLSSSHPCTLAIPADDLKKNSCNKKADTSVYIVERDRFQRPPGLIKKGPSHEFTRHSQDRPQGET